YSNGVIEWINRKIKLLNRMSYGFKYFTYLRTRVFLVQEKLFKPS
ncbi:transposase, partial [Granulicatella sp. 19428wC4_WM01]